MNESTITPERQLTSTNVEIRRRVWELPLAILLWTYIGLGVFLILAVIATLSSNGSSL